MIFHQQNSLKVFFARFAVVLLGLFLSLDTIYTKAPLANQEELQTQSQTDNKAPVQPVFPQVQAGTLNTLLEKELAQLDKLESIIQYLGQVAPRSLILEKPHDVQNWIRETQRVIHIIRTSHTLPLTTSQIDFIARTTFQLTKSIQFHLQNRLTTVQTFDPSSRKQSGDEVSIKDIKDQMKETDSALSDLADEVDIMGLSFINILARAGRAVWTHYGMNKLVSTIIPATFLGGSALYYAPKEYFQSTHWLLRPITRLKEFVGNKYNQTPAPTQQPTQTHKVRTRLGYRKITVTSPASTSSSMQPTVDGLAPNVKGTGFVGAIENVVSDIGFKSILATVLASGVISRAALEEGNFFNRAMLGFDSLWRRLEGHSLPRVTRYVPIDNISFSDERLTGVKPYFAMMEPVLEYIMNPEVYDRCNAAPPKAILLTGPSGNGKTLFAQAVCGELNNRLKTAGKPSRFAFKAVSFEEIVWSREGIKSVLDEAKYNAPCILFLDELHIYKGMQTQGSDGGEILHRFLTQLSGINDADKDGRHQIVLLAATNQPELLDGALLRSGRFGTILRFEKPSFDQRRKYIEVHLKQSYVDPAHLDVESIVRQTAGCSYADLDAIIKFARFKARNQARAICQEYLQECIDRQVKRLHSDDVLSEQEKQMIAAHLAGHAFMYMFQDTQEKLESITLRSKWRKIKEMRHWDASQLKEQLLKKTKHGALFTYNEYENLAAVTTDELAKQCRIKLAGATAENLLLGHTSTYHQKDKLKAYTYAKAIVFDGMVESQLPESVRKSLTLKAYQLVKQYERETEDMLKAHQNVLKRISQQLIERTTLYADDIHKIMTESGN